MTVLKRPTTRLCTTDGCVEQTPYHDMLRTSNGNFCNEDCQTKHLVNIRHLRDEERRKQK